MKNNKQFEGIQNHKNYGHLIISLDVLSNHHWNTLHSLLTMKRHQKMIDAYNKDRNTKISVGIFKGEIFHYHGIV